MNIPGFYSLASSWLFLFLIPLVIFYFLKLKRPRVEISSLVLWRQVINDQRVNSPFQKFKRNLLLLLQLLLLTSLILAAMQPFFRAGAERAEYLPLLIDCSASMGAKDADGRTRLAVAKQRAGQLIEDLLPDQRMSIIAAGATARRMTNFTDNKTLLREGLDRIQVLDVPSQLEDALRMSQALARNVPIETVLVYSDGNVPQQIDFELPFNLNYQQIPKGGSNMGIISLNARRNQADRWDVFVRLSASPGQEAVGEVTILQDGASIGDEQITLDAGKSQRIVFPVMAGEESLLEVRLKPSTEDSLEADNVAFLNLPKGRPLKVYCSEGLATYRHALSVLPYVDVHPRPDAERPSVFDLLIAEQAVADLEANVRLQIGEIPDALSDIVSVDSGAAVVIDWRRNSELLKHIQFADVLITDDVTTEPGKQESDFEALGFEVLAHGRSGPLIVKKRTGRRVTYHFLFHTDRSTLPYRIGFPILITNLVETALREAELSEVRGNTTGVLPEIVLESNQSYRVAGPNTTGFRSCERCGRGNSRCSGTVRRQLLIPSWWRPSRAGGRGAIEPAGNRPLPQSRSCVFVKWPFPRRPAPSRTIARYGRSWPCWGFPCYWRNGGIFTAAQRRCQRQRNCWRSDFCACPHIRRTPSTRPKAPATAGQEPQGSR